MRLSETAETNAYKLVRQRLEVYKAAERETNETSGTDLRRCRARDKGYTCRAMWYRAFSWPENPFSIRPSPHVVGLEEIKEALLQDLLSGSPALLLGPTGMGKTSLLLWLRGRLNETRFSPVYLNIHNLPSPQDRALRTRLRSAIFLRRLRLSAGPILLLDEAQEITAPLAEWLKSAFDRGLLFSFALACYTEPVLPQPLRSRIGPNLYRLHELSLPERVALLKARMNGRNPFTEEALVLLAQAAGPSPRALLQAAELVCKRLAFKAELREPITPANFTPFLPAATSPADETKTEETPSATVSRPLDAPRDETTPTRRETNPSVTSMGTLSRSLRFLQGETKRDSQSETRDKRETKGDKSCLTLSPMQEHILRLLAEEPRTIAELCELLGSSPGSVRRQLSRLRAASPPLIHVLPGSGHKRFVLSEAGRRALARHR